MLHCERIEQDLIAYMDGKANPAARRQVETHLAGCAACRQRAEEFRLLAGLLDELPEVLPSASFDAAVRARVAAEPSRRSFWAYIVPPTRLTFATAALVMFSVWMLTVRLPRPAVVAVVQPQISEADFAMIKDLPALEDYDVLSNFDALSDLPVQPAAAKTQPRAQRSKI